MSGFLHSIRNPRWRPAKSDLERTFRGDTSGSKGGWGEKERRNGPEFGSVPRLLESLLTLISSIGRKSPIWHLLVGTMSVLRFLEITKQSFFHFSSREGTRSLRLGRPRSRFTFFDQALPNWGGATGTRVVYEKDKDVRPQRVSSSPTVPRSAFITYRGSKCKKKSPRTNVRRNVLGSRAPLYWTSAESDGGRSHGSSPFPSREGQSGRPRALTRIIIVPSTQTIGPCRIASVYDSNTHFIPKVGFVISTSGDFTKVSRPTPPRTRIQQTCSTINVHNICSINISIKEVCPIPFVILLVA